MKHRLHLHTPENKLLFLLSMIDLSADQRAQAQDLIEQVTDWKAFLGTARRKHVLPMVMRHLRSLEVASIDPALTRAADAVVADQAIHNLKSLSELHRFVDTCLGPSGASFVAFKGVVLAKNYYPDPGLRPGRDLDIAVRPEDLERLVRKSVAEGYLLHAPNGQGGTITEERDIRALLHYARSALLVSPMEIVIDLQPGIDKFSGIFDSETAFANTVPREIGGKEIQTFSDIFLFNYLCHHHARHLWSRLHWVSDLDAILGAPGFDLDAAVKMADDLGQRGTVEAALAFHRLAGDPMRWPETPRASGDHGAAFLNLCLSNLAGDLQLEKNLAIRLIGGEFMFRWQAKPELLQTAKRNWLRTMLRPTYQQYQTLPLPEGLQWVYYPLRLVQIGTGTLKRLFGRDAGRVEA